MTPRLQPGSDPNLSDLLGRHRCGHALEQGFYTSDEIFAEDMEPGRWFGRGNGVKPGGGEFRGKQGLVLWSYGGAVTPAAVLDISILLYLRGR